VATKTLLPTADATYTAWSLSGGTDHYALVDDPVGSPDDETTYVYSTTASQGDSYTFENLGEAGATITNVRVHTRCRRYSASNYSYAVLFRASATNYIQAYKGATGDDAFGAQYWDLAENPDTSSAWTNTDLTGSEWGIATAASAGGRVVTQIYLEVTYTTGVTFIPKVIII